MPSSIMSRDSPSGIATAGYLLERLHFTVSVAIFFWLWGWATYYMLKYFNEKPITGIHTVLKEGLAEQMGIKEPFVR